MKISILDQAPISPGGTAFEALKQAVKLAQHAEEWGYTRYWIAEHHDIQGLACSAPEVMLPYIGAQTKKIRIGSGAVLLPHYKPYKIAEVFHMMATLFPGRIDIGVGRAPGGSAEATMALSDNFLGQVYKMPELLKELLQFINDNFPKEHMYSKISASPLPDVPPQPWLLGTSKKSALLAAELGMAYAFGHFMSDNDGFSIVNSYQENFQSNNNNSPDTIVCVSVICAETTKEAERLALESYYWRQEKKQEGLSKSIHLNENEKNEELLKMKEKLIIGDPSLVGNQLKGLSRKYQTAEIMMITMTPKFSDRLRSYELIAQELLTKKGF